MLRPLIALIISVTLLAQQQTDVPVFKAAANLVLVTAFVRDKSGKSVENLKKDDFTVLENGKPQAVSVFEFQRVTEAPSEAPPQRLLQRGEERTRTLEPQPKPPEPQEKTGSERFRDRRLMVLFFDWSSLPDTDQIRAIEAADKFVREQMTPADLVAIKSFGTKLKNELDFTNDRDLLLSTIRKFIPGQASELAALGNTDTDTSDDASFMADETEFNVFNTDRKLGAIEDIARSLQAIPEKKAVVYFSSGVTKTGMDNESQLRATINAAIRANVSLYPIDVRGLIATPAGGGASARSPRGNAIYTGAGQTRNMRAQNDSQETLYNLAADTGGKALLDENDLTLGMQQAQKDIQSYYVLGYYSSDERRDGQFRKVEVKLTPAVQAKIDYRAGYFADKEFRAFSAYDRERQLQDALTLGDPITDLPLALEVNYFRLDKERYFVPVAVKIPGSAVPVAKKGGADTTHFDFIGEVRSDKGVIAANVRDEIKIQLRDENAGKLASKSLVYDTGFVLAHGAYKMRMLVRENTSGKMGTFEAKFEIPDLANLKDSVKLSSVVWSNQRQAVSGAVGIADSKLKKQESHPLVRSGQKLIPSVTRVFRTDQSLIVYAEVYDPSLSVDTERPLVAATLSLYQNRQKVFESRAVRIDQMLATRSKTAPVMIEIPLRNLSPGAYTGQLNVFDQVGQRYGFERARIVIAKPS